MQMCSAQPTPSYHHASVDVLSLTWQSLQCSDWRQATGQSWESRVRSGKKDAYDLLGSWRARSDDVRSCGNSAEAAKPSLTPESLDGLVQSPPTSPHSPTSIAQLVRPQACTSSRPMKLRCRKSVNIGCSLDVQVIITWTG
jgi:hypothetical protein